MTILGKHITKFGELWDRSLEDLLKEAVGGAVADAGVERSEIEAVFVANMAAGNFENQAHLGAMVSQMFDHFPPGMRIEGACASGSLALVAAQQAIMSGQYETVLVVGVEKMNDVTTADTTQILASAADVSSEVGSTFPGLYALFAGQYMREFGLNREQLSAVAVQNHGHGMDNPDAQFHKKFTIDQVSNSAKVADPLTMLDCSPITDGAAAVVLTKKSKKGKAQILGFGHGQDSLDIASRKSFTELAATKRAVQQALKSSGVSLDKIELAEVHDCFTIAEIMAIEDLGFFPRGEAGQAVLDGETTYGGKVVVNPSGGLKACGHPVGATGVKQVAYLARMLESGEYKLALAHNVGGSGATAVVHILGTNDH